MNGFRTLETRLRALARVMKTLPVRRFTTKVSIAHLCSYNTNKAAVGAAFWTAVLGAFSSVEHLCAIVLPFVPPELPTDLLELLRALQPAYPVLQDGTDLADIRRSLLTRLSIHGEFGQGAEEALAGLEALAECLGAHARAIVHLEELDVHFWHRDRWAGHIVRFLRKRDAPWGSSFAISAPVRDVDHADEELDGISSAIRVLQYVPSARKLCQLF